MAVLTQGRLNQYSKRLILLEYNIVNVGKYFDHRELTQLFFFINVKEIVNSSYNRYKNREFC